MLLRVTPRPPSTFKLALRRLYHVQAFDGCMIPFQELAAGMHSATPAARLPGGAASDLIEELDRSLQQLQHACHTEPGPDGELVALATTSSMHSTAHVFIDPSRLPTAAKSLAWHCMVSPSKQCAVLQVWT